MRLFTSVSMKKMPLSLLATCQLMSSWPSRRVILPVWLLSLVLFSGLAHAEDFLDLQINVNVRANTPLEDALIDWGTAAGFTVMINTETVHGRFAPEVRGHLTAREALTALLKNSGLSYTRSGRRILVVPASTPVHSSRSEAVGANGVIT